MIKIIVTPTTPGRFSAKTEFGKVLVASSKTPFFDAARALLDQGTREGEPLVMVTNGIRSLSSTVGYAADLTVEDRNEGRVRYRRYRPYSAAGNPLVRSTAQDDHG